MKILVTGAAGQLGRSLPAALAGHEVDARTRHELDIRDREATASAIADSGAELVINAAAWNRVDDAESMARDAFLSNAVGPRNLALATAACGIPIIHVSTDYVFDGSGSRPLVESDRPAPRSVYGASKLAGEEAVRSANPRHHIARTAWVFHEDGANFLNTMLDLARRGPLKVVDDQTGSPTWAPHLAEALAELVMSTDFGVRHLAGSGSTSWYGLTRALFDEMGVDADLEPTVTENFPRPAPRPAFSALATERDLKLPAWEDGLRNFCRNRRNRP